jgi:pimeloyl-ACP methyl ester carboxylesterase
MSSSQVTILPDSGHLPWLDDPAEHATIISAFCDQLEG